ncbi:hypothetical protein F2Q68_00039304 [Brassica cretica]|uniref:Uncharacterized protein n=1 Tax=Brassica cretica TaxID=69181 RepID=A0A8S9MU27_BRACR|nr:hypothetical protein F2Q68_00039304 [Brassica cretica]
MHIGGVRGSRDVWASNAYYIIVYPYEENAGYAYIVVVLCTESVVCGLASHTSLGDSPVAHPSFFPLQGEVLDSSNAKRINNLSVDVEAVPPTPSPSSCSLISPMMSVVIITIACLNNQLSLLINSELPFITGETILASSPL